MNVSVLVLKHVDGLHPVFFLHAFLFAYWSWLLIAVGLGFSLCWLSLCQEKESVRSGQWFQFETKRHSVFFKKNKNKKPEIHLNYVIEFSASRGYFWEI